MLRYRTGDVTRLDPEPCRCGRTTVRMARIKGRTDDMLVIKGRQRVSLAGRGRAPHAGRAGPALPARGGPDRGLPDARRARRAGRAHSYTRGAASTPRRPELAALSARVAERLRGHLGPQPRDRHRPAQDHPPQRGEGGAGGGKEMSMADATEERLLARIEAGERIESAEEMTDEYRENLIHLMTMQADSELAGGYGYVPWIMKAPSVEEKHVVAQIVKDELRHAAVMYGLLADLGRGRGRPRAGARRGLHHAHRRRRRHRHRAHHRRQAGEHLLLPDRHAGPTSSSSTSAWTAGPGHQLEDVRALLLRAVGARHRGHLQGGEVPHPPRRALGQAARRGSRRRATRRRRRSTSGTSAP